ncbi:MAG: NINE protein [Betaproteobacteria bacterium]|nr:MAG: NINE protein [Betaproteobacteria bacterium]
MNASLPPSGLPPQPPLPPSPPAVAPIVVRPTFGARLWRGFGATPWWRLIFGGLLIIVASIALMVPYDTMVLANRIRSDIGKDALKISLQREVLERARGGLLVVRSLAADEDTVAEIDSTIAELNHEISKPLVDQFDGDVDQLRIEIATLRTEAKRKTETLSKAASKIANDVAAGRSHDTEEIERLSGELGEISGRLHLLERQLRTMEGRGEGGKNGKTTTRVVAEVDGKKAVATISVEDGKPTRVTVNSDGVSKQVVASSATVATTAKPAAAMPPVPPVPPVAPVAPHQITASANTKFSASDAAILFPGEPGVAEISATVSRDVTKLLYAGTLSLALIILFVFMLVARAFAGRAARGEQRAVIAESRERTESHARQLAEAKLTLMRAQVEPHFLFNTLAHVQALQEIDPPQASNMLERLISYLRAAMPSMRDTSSTLAREIDVVRAYLDLLKIRMGDRLKYVINVPIELGSVALPPTMIATLVENAIKHGLEPKKEGGTIAINVRKLPGDHGGPDVLEVLVADDGLGLGGAQTQGTGVGLANTRERLKMLYGTAGQLIVEPNAPSGVRALMRVPTVVPETIEQAEHYPTDDGAAGVSRYTVLTVGLLALFVGWLGVHRFYVGHRRTGALQTVLGVLSVGSGGVPLVLLPLIMWVILDLVWIVTRDFTDGRGLRVVRLDGEDRRSYVGNRVPSRPRDPSASPKSRALAMGFVLPLGFLGAHRFYVGRSGTGLAMLLTLGGLGIWWLIDIVIVICGQLKDSEGKWVSEWE